MVVVLHVGVIVAQDAGKKPAARTAVTALPSIPAPLHDALAGKQFAQAVKLIDAELKKEKVLNADYLLYLKGRALTELKSFDAATASFALLEENHAGFHRSLSRGLIFGLHLV